MKKALAFLLTGIMALSMAACGGSGSSPAQPAAGTDSSAAANGDLVTAAQEEGTLVVYGSCEEDYLAAACENFEKLYGIKVQ